MSRLEPDVPIIGQRHQAVISDISIVMPNSIEAVDNGLACGPSVAHIQVTNPLRGKQWRVPLTMQQLEFLIAQLTAIWSNPQHTPTQEQASDGKR